MKFFLTSSKKKENGILAKDDLEKTQQYSYLFSPDYSKMHSKKAIEKLEKLKYFRYPDDAKLKLKEKFPFNEMDEEEINMCIEEFKKYIGLVLIRQYEKTRYYKNKYSRVAMASDIIDEVWHNLILFSNYYYEFSTTLFGTYLHHTPSTPNSPLTDNDIKRFIGAYREYFGSINPIWYYKINKNNKTKLKEVIVKTDIHNESTDKRPIKISYISKSSLDLNENRFSRIEENVVALQYLTMNSIIYSMDTTMPYYIPDDVFAESDIGEDGGGDGGCGGCGGCG